MFFNTERLSYTIKNDSISRDLHDEVAQLALQYLVDGRSEDDAVRVLREVIRSVRNGDVLAML